MLGAPVLGELDLHLLAEGRHWRAWEALGAHPAVANGTPGTRFAVWAPNARSVSVIGDFNGWDSRAHPMRHRPDAGVFELFVPGVGSGALYKFELVGATGERLVKADPYARASERPPATASRVAPPQRFVWSDVEWLAERAHRHATDQPLAIYELHAGSWRRDARSFRALAATLVPYVQELGFTHIELLPVYDHPFGGSWGYQPTGLYAPSAVWGDADELRALIDACHAARIGVLLDWVPAHFPEDAHALARFDGTHLYDHEDPRLGRHPDWGTLIYNYGRREVANFLVANALYWLREFHIDGLRVDAVASMLYRDYSRAHGEWLPNASGGRENLEALAFVRTLNDEVRAQVPDALMIAEESTAWPGVTGATADGGLGFHYKWNMGWMNDTLRYFRHDPVHRAFHHNALTFGQTYAHSERFLLPLSHDEVVHGKGSLLGKMPGDRWQQLANLRLLLAWQYLQPGKKLLFMGGELAQEREWNHDGELDWQLLAHDGHRGVQRLVGDLNRLYRGVPALHEGDCAPYGFRWIDCGDAAQSVLAWQRIDRHGGRVVVVCNFTPVVRGDYRVGVPLAGTWRELLNTDAHAYGGSDVGNLGTVDTDDAPWHGEPYSLVLTLPPLAALVLEVPS